MRAEAEAALPGLDADGIRSINQRAVRSVDELRRLLGILREPPPEPPEPEPRARPLWHLDMLLGAALAVIALALWAVSSTPLWPATDAARPSILVFYGPIVLALAVRRTAPAVACLLAAVGNAVLLIDAPTIPELLLPATTAYLLLTWAIVTGGPARRTVRVIALGVLAATALLGAAGYGPTAVGFVASGFALAILAGLEWNDHDARLVRAEGERTRLQQRLDSAAAAALHAERLRLARELHDVASHSVGAMVMQAGAAQALREKDPPAARAALRTVDEVGERALGEVADLLRTVEADEGTVRDIRALRALIDQARRAGLRIEEDLSDEALPPPLAAVALHVVAEGLHNVERHAPGADIRIAVRRESDTVTVTVHDTGPPLPAAANPGAGFGLAGLAERVQACGGAFHAGAVGPAGFLVEARLPAVPEGGAP